MSNSLGGHNSIIYFHFIDEACGWNLDLLISNFHYIIIYLTQCK